MKIKQFIRKKQKHTQHDMSTVRLYANIFKDMIAENPLCLISMADSGIHELPSEYKIIPSIEEGC